jgi:nucleotide-binding universal stress UspA family protein
MKISIQRILFPTDFSKPAEEAQKYAEALADRFGAELHLFHVVPMVVPFPDGGSPWVMPEKEMEFQVRTAADRLSNLLSANCKAKASAKCSAVIGFAVDEILKYEKANDIDLIVVGTHGHTGLSHFLIGSVVEKLVRLASCPVLTVHPTGHQFVIESGTAAK